MRLSRERSKVLIKGIAPDIEDEKVFSSSLLMYPLLDSDLSLAFLIKNNYNVVKYIRKRC